MDSPDIQRLRELLSRLIGAFQYLLEFPTDARLRAEAGPLLDQLIAVQESSDETLIQGVEWPTMREAIFSFLNDSVERGVDSFGGRTIVDLLSGNQILYFSTPPVSEGEVARAFTDVFLEADAIISRARSTTPAGGVPGSAAPPPEQEAADSVESRSEAEKLADKLADETPADEQADLYPEAPALGAFGQIPWKHMDRASAASERDIVADRWDEAETEASVESDEAPGAAYAPPSAEEDVAYSVEQPAVEETQRKDPKTPERVVNTGFSQRGGPAAAIDADSILAVDTPYWFWLEIGKLVRDSIEVVATGLPASVPANALLTVAVFSFPDELKLTAGADLGTVRLAGAVESVVVDQPGGIKISGSDQHPGRLFFPVETPPKPGSYRLRCNIYYEHVLLQSRVVTAHVSQTPDVGRSLQSNVDFNLSRTLDPARLSRMASQTLSIFINDNSDGTHGFYFEGQQNVKTQAVLDADRLQDSLTQARKTLRTVAWGKPDSWKPDSVYLYDSQDEDRMKADLIALAIRGYMVYSALIDGISGNVEASRKLAALMRHPGSVQISSKESARFVVPAALFYDQPLNTQAKKHTVCDAFLAVLRAHGSLHDSPCFQGECPHLKEFDVVCPSGFWGYRHELGLPVSIEAATAGDAQPDIEFNNPASMLAIVSLDKAFIERGPHQERLRTIRTPMTFTLCDGRAQAIDAMQHCTSEVVYFYCHGGMTESNTPFLTIGDDEHLTPDNIRLYEIQWKAPRPLVFMNGCMTAALEPEKAIEFVSAFINMASASGVIGTEITVFEPLATKFAESFLDSFMGKCKSIGESIKLARLNLLEQFNPLGLVYIPFALPGLRLVDLGAPALAREGVEV